jgi:hypothetical protein
MTGSSTMTGSSSMMSTRDLRLATPRPSSRLLSERSLPRPTLDPCTAGLLRELSREAGPTEAPFLGLYRARFADRF